MHYLCSEIIRSAKYSKVSCVPNKDTREKKDILVDIHVSHHDILTELEKATKIY